jgi:hypothetical protein
MYRQQSFEPDQIMNANSIQPSAFLVYSMKAKRQYPACTKKGSGKPSMDNRMGLVPRTEGTLPLQPQYDILQTVMLVFLAAQ